MRLSIPEILGLVSEAPAAERVAVLQKHDTPVLRQVLQINFDKNVVLDLPAGDAPYKPDPNPIGLSESNLYNEARRLYICIKDHPRRPPTIKKMQVENIWIQILEGIHSSEAQLLCQIKDRKLSTVYKGITEKLVREAFPDLLSEKA